VVEEVNTPLVYPPDASKLVPSQEGKPNLNAARWLRLGRGVSRPVTSQTVLPPTAVRAKLKVPMDTVAAKFKLSHIAEDIKKSRPPEVCCTTSKSLDSGNYFYLQIK